MHRPRRLTFAALAVAAATVLAACGDDDTAGTSASTTASTSSESTTSTSETTETTGTTGSSGSSTGASGSGDVGSKQDYIDAAESAIGFGDEDIRGCVATAVVSDKVYAAIRQTGLSVDDFGAADSLGKLKVSADEAASVADDMAACGDLLPQLISDEDRLTCAKENLSNTQVAQILAYSLFQVDLPEDLQTANNAVGQCAQGSVSPSTVAPSTTA